VVQTYTYRYPSNLFEHIQELKWYGQEDKARNRLYLIAKYIDNKYALNDFEKRWLNEDPWK
jgi:hypothetical protein